MSTLAAKASYCAANQWKYWQYHDEHSIIIPHGSNKLEIKP